MEECFFFRFDSVYTGSRKTLAYSVQSSSLFVWLKIKSLKKPLQHLGFLLLYHLSGTQFVESLSLLLSFSPLFCVFVCVKVCSLVRACICMQHPTRHPGSESLAAVSALRGLIGARGSCGLTDVNTPQLLISDLWKQTVPWRSDRCSPPRVLHQRARSTWPLTRSMCPDAVPPAADPGMPLYLAGLRKAITVLTDQLKRKICSHDCYRTGFKKKKFIEKV